ncbi:MAG: glycosyltransferase [Actinomycetota bacterium]
MTADQPALEVAALTGALTDPSARFRVRQLIAPLAPLGVSVTDLPSTAGRYPPPGRWRRPVWLAEAGLDAARRALRSRSFDAVILQRELVSTLPTFEWATGTPRILDVDDAIHLRQRLRSADRIARGAAAIFCGNEHLAEYFDRFASTVVVPTVVDTARYAPPDDRAGSSGEAPIIGWIGTSSNLPELERIAAPLERVLSTRPDVRLHVVSNRPDAWSLAAHPSVVEIPWSADSEIDLIRSFDVGLMPLADTPWTRGKCGFKLITYLACGRAAVASPVGVNRTILDSDQQLLPDSDERWVEAILNLIDDPDRRRDVGRRGRNRIVSEYSVEAVAPRIASTIRSVTN